MTRCGENLLQKAGKKVPGTVQSQFRAPVCFPDPTARVGAFGALDRGGTILAPTPRFSMSLYFPTPEECSRHTIFPGVRIRTCAAEHLMMSLVDLEPHSVVEEHSHPHEQVGMLLEGRATFFIGGEEKTLQAGDMWRIPGGVKHRVVALDRPVKALDIFYPVREDYR
jgi:quercetin dioxygenase-like cupin family protein